MGLCKYTKKLSSFCEVFLHGALTTLSSVTSRKLLCKRYLSCR